MGVIEILRLKLARADANVEQLKAALGIGPNAVGPLKTHGIDLQPDGTLHYSTNAPIPGPDCGIILGDALHQFRSVLDHLVCAFASRGKTHSICEKFRLQCPIHKDLLDFCANTLVSQGTLKLLIGAKEFQLIEEAQPYKRNTINPTADPLYILSQLDNIDKHRIVLIFDQRLAISGYFETADHIEVFATTHQKVKPGTQVLDVRRPIPDRPFTVHVDDMAPFIVFAETNTAADGMGVFPMLRAMQGLVVGIVEDSAKFF